MFVSLRNSSETGTSDGRNTSVNDESRMDERSEYMLYNTANPNNFAGGVQDDPLNMFRVQSSDVLGKEFHSVEEAEEYYHKYSFINGFSVRKDDLRKNKQGVVTLRRWVCSKKGYTSKKYAENANRVRESVGVKTAQVTDHMVDMAGGYASVGHTKKDLQNRIDVERRKLFSESNANAIIGYMTAKSEVDKEFSTIDETVETYCWITKTFLKAMHEKCPKSVVTDGDQAMHKAIKSEMAGSVHRHCSWHLQRNAQTNLSISDFCGAFSHCMAAFMLETKFEMKWEASIEKFGLHGNAWVRKMYAKRKQWAEIFLRDSFFGRIRSTQRSESINAYMNRFLSCRLKLYKFIRQIDRAMARLCHTEAKDDFETLNERPVLVMHLPSYEKQAAKCTVGGYSSGFMTR
ncbi:hypothetical protein JRO89_XS06G0217800 [Xanthoceras sorbifolium]|uniref:MULE transposase domain-containing protein n=1 Tax=Xanthoceras sorbifolium TaxID=99658 RepID=A0ABQ8HZ24_9ROSI|nr:hypothetical protein JRO89_XS06G0217800 [Xanthoceras sorbifolium]